MVVLRSIEDIVKDATVKCEGAEYFNEQELITIKKIVRFAMEEQKTVILERLENELSDYQIILITTDFPVEYTGSDIVEEIKFDNCLDIK